ncbi:MAG: nickel-dependent lactate racemase [Methanophagales archaeon]|nr:nickel-dependent lactate racemase [Methanophagales archaeon]MCW3141303.1 nickel-dependent lactate racemase [Methanophagales archaeon]
MTKLQIPYGSSLINVGIEGKLLALEGDRSKANHKNHDAITHALQNPIDANRLRAIVNARKDAKIIIVVDDHTREAPTEKILDALTAEIGEKHKKQITLLVACGTHAAPAEADLKRILGKHYTQYNLVIHDCDAPDLVFVGTTSRGTPVLLNRNYVEADIKILTGDISLHYYAGFGGGRKSILPGISSRETIKKNHALLVDERATTTNIVDNPVHLDMCEAASFAPPHFVINTVSDAAGNLVDAYAGEMNAVFLKGAEVAKDLFCLETDDLFDILLVSAGGFPKDRNLYQATKAIQNCYRAVVPGGELILVAECREGIGDLYFEDWMNRYATYEAAEDAIKTNFVLGGHKAFYIRRIMNRVRLSIVSELDTHILMRWGINAYESVEDALLDKNDKVKIGIVKKGLDTLLLTDEIKEEVRKKK